MAPAPGQETPPCALPQTSMTGTDEGNEAGALELGAAPEAHEEPLPEKALKQVAGSQYAGPVSHFYGILLDICLC